MKANVLFRRIEVRRSGPYFVPGDDPAARIAIEKYKQGIPFPILAPGDDAALEALGKIQEPDVMARIWRPRSLPMHNLFFAALALAVERAPRPGLETVDQLRAALKYHLGLYDIVQTFDGKRFFSPKSMRFEEMDQAEFQSVFDQAMRLICDHMMGGMDTEDFLREVRTSMGAAAA